MRNICKSCKKELELVKTKDYGIGLFCTNPNCPNWRFSDKHQVDYIC